MPSTGCIGVPAILQDAPAPSSREPSDTPVAELVAAAQHGDMEAFGQLYDRFWGMVFAYSYKRLRCPAQAEDIACDTFLRAQVYIGGFVQRPGHVFEAWLVTIARNLIADHYKRSSTRREIFTPVIFDLDTTAASPEHDLLLAAEQRTLREALGRLTPDQRQCVTLRYLHQMSTRETAEAMGRAESVVKTLLWRSLRALARDRALLKWVADR